MKRHVFAWVLTLCLAVCATALANSWGAPGGTVSLFENTAYEDYTVAAEDYSRSEKTARLIVENRYHRQLWWVEKTDGEWRIVCKSTTAVYQPDSGRAAADRPVVMRDAGGFGLIYEAESYWFDADMVLQRARYTGEDGMIMLSYNGTDAYLAEDDGGSAYWYVWGGLKLEDFNVSLMPRSVPDAVHMNRMSSMLHEVFNSTVQVTKTDKSKQAVYSAPDKKAFRAAKGKAVVSLKSLDGLTLLGRWNGWDAVEYEVSARTSRIGYIQGGHIHDGYSWDEEFCAIPAVAAEDTFITDDPGVSQYPTAELARGMEVTLLGRYGQYYAHVETTIDGQPARGFVPLRSLEVQERSLDQVIAHITGGPYEIRAGGDMIPSGITFRADGSFAAELPESEPVTGTWSVRTYDPQEQLFWNQPPYALEMVYDGTGREIIRGLTPMQDGFSLTNEEGGGGYALKE
ncbi:MAG: hypothetical protein IJ507_02295 [Clostridia bacterium]|nr:hypothetical protein [Clostridia bacterium]